MLAEWNAQTAVPEAVRRGGTICVRSGHDDVIDPTGGQARTRLALWWPGASRVARGIGISRSAGPAWDHLTVPAGAADGLPVEALANVRAVRDDHRGTPDLGEEIAAAWIGKEKPRDVLNLRARITGVHVVRARPPRQARLFL